MSNDKSQILPKTERTPGPWYVKDNTVLGQQDNIIAECPKYGCSILCEGEIAPQHRAKENAAFIVKACNLHDELVEMLKEARLTVEAELANLDGSDYEDTVEDTYMRKEFFNNIDALLAKAQEV